MSLRQVSVFIENKNGRLAAITGELRKAEINIRALSLADTANFGVLRFIADDPDKAAKVLKDKGISVTLTEVTAVVIPDNPGALADILDILTENRLGIEYSYAFLGLNEENNATVILRIENSEKAAEVLGKAGIKLL